jgi:hypothetical protein
MGRRIEAFEFLIPMVDFAPRPNVIDKVTSMNKLIYLYF